MQKNASEPEQNEGSLTQRGLLIEEENVNVDFFDSEQKSNSEQVQPKLLRTIMKPLIESEDSWQSEVISFSDEEEVKMPQKKLNKNQLIESESEHYSADQDPIVL